MGDWSSGNDWCFGSIRQQFDCYLPLAVCDNIGDIKMEKNETKRYYVDFYDMVDGWGTFGFFTDRLFDDIDLAIELCKRLNSELDDGNKSCGGHYGVIVHSTGREVYCGIDEKYKIKISDLKIILPKQPTTAS